MQTPNNAGVIEACDTAENNGVACDPAYGESCTYCAADCSEVLTVDATAFCGNGVIDKIGEVRLGDVFGNDDPALDQIVAEYERCDVIPGTDTVIASNLYDPIEVIDGQEGLAVLETLARAVVLGAGPETLNSEQKICQSPDGYVAKGKITCDNECRVLNTTGCVNCGLYGNAGKAVPKLALLNVLSPREADTEWANRWDDLRQRAFDENNRPIRNADGTFVEGEPINGLANQTRLTLNDAIDSWRRYDPINKRNVNSAFLCLQQKWDSRRDGSVFYSQKRDCSGDNRFTNEECKEQHRRYVRGWNYTNYMQPQWLCYDGGTFAPLDRGYGYEKISDATRNAVDPNQWEWDNYTENIRQIESSPLCTEEYSVYFGSRGIASERAQEFWSAGRGDIGDLYKRYGDFFPYPVDGEAGVVQNSMILSPAIPRNNFRVVVRSKPSEDDGVFGFVGNVYSKKYGGDPLTEQTNGRLSYTDIVSRDAICSRMEQGDAADGIWNGYWKPKIDARCGIYSGTTMNQLGTIQDISAQATTIDVSINAPRPQDNAQPFAFYVSAVTNNADVPITSFLDRDVQVEVYTYHDGQVPSYSVYKPTYVFQLNRATQSENADLAKYWHVFNIVNVNGTYQIQSATRDPQSVGTGVVRDHGSIETGFVDVLCNVPGEPCNRE